MHKYYGILASVFYLYLEVEEEYTYNFLFLEIYSLHLSTSSYDKIFRNQTPFLVDCFALWEKAWLPKLHSFLNSVTEVSDCLNYYKSPLPSICHLKEAFICQSTRSRDFCIIQICYNSSYLKFRIFNIDYCTLFTMDGLVSLPCYHVSVMCFLVFRCAGGISNSTPCFSNGIFCFHS